METGRVHGRILDGVATVVLDNPAKRNAMTNEMWNTLPSLLDQLAADQDVAVLVITGAGDTFCAGADISTLTGFAPGEPMPATVAEDALVAFPKPVVAAIRGWCVGGGCQIAVACDLRIAEQGSRFGITPAKIGVVYPAATTGRLVELVGPAAAKFLLFTGDFIDDERALRTGLVDELVPPGGLEARVGELARTLASRSRLTQHAAKDLIRATLDGRPTAEGYRRWAAEGAAELAEGVAAFAERRVPSFPWRP
jgi:enoyl-CoA hydratase/carnithine racemase